MRVWPGRGGRRKARPCSFCACPAPLLIPSFRYSRPPPLFLPFLFIALDFFGFLFTLIFSFSCTPAALAEGFVVQILITTSTHMTHMTVLFFPFAVPPFPPLLLFFPPRLFRHLCCCLRFWLFSVFGFKAYGPWLLSETMHLLQAEPDRGGRREVFKLNATVARGSNATLHVQA